MRNTTPDFDLPKPNNDAQYGMGILGLICICCTIPIFKISKVAGLIWGFLSMTLIYKLASSYRERVLSAPPTMAELLAEEEAERLAERDVKKERIAS